MDILKGQIIKNIKPVLVDADLWQLRIETEEGFLCIGAPRFVVTGFVESEQFEYVTPTKEEG